MTILLDFVFLPLICVDRDDVMAQLTLLVRRCTWYWFDGDQEEIRRPGSDDGGPEFKERKAPDEEDPRLKSGDVSEKWSNAWC